MGLFDFLKNGNSSRVFLLDGSNPSTPKQFGFSIVKSAIDNSHSDLMEIIGGQESEIKKGIQLRVQGAQLLFVALHAAVVYVYALKILTVPKDVLAELYEGMVIGFNKLLVNADGTGVNNSAADFLEKGFRLYSKSLYDELTSPNDNNDPFDLGPTAALIVEGIGVVCNVQEHFYSEAQEVYRLKQISARNGILLLMRFIENKYIDYRP